MNTITQTSTTQRRLARLATEILAPWVWVLCLPLAVAWQVTHALLPTLGWGLIVGITGSVIPMGVIVWGARQGRWSSHHVTNREGRAIPFAACITSMCVGLAILIAGSAPREMISLATAMFASLIVTAAITFGARWKISMHAAVASGATLILMDSYGPWLAVLGVGTALVCWSRVELGDHTLAQVLVGAATGAVTGGALYIGLNSSLGA